MRSDFARVLSNLRKEKNISQRHAAEDLEISQALLSHYEKGTREPGLAFVVRAGDYYNVSADFLLGRSMSKDGSALKADQIHDPSQDKDNVLNGSIAAMIQRKLIVNSISLIFDIIGKTKNKDLINEISTYLYFPIYKVYRYLLSKNENDTKFNTPEIYFDHLCDCEMKLREVKIKALCENDNRYTSIEKPLDFSHITPDLVAENYPKYAQSMFTISQSASDIIAVSTNPHVKTFAKKTKNLKKNVDK